MGFLDGLCDMDPGEKISWSSFWRLNGLCSVTTLCAAVPCIYAASTTLILLLQTYVCKADDGDNDSLGGLKRNKFEGDGSLNGFAAGGDRNGGHEEAKGENGEDGNGFIDNATEPLLGRGNHGHELGTNRAGRAGARGGGDDIDDEEQFVDGEDGKKGRIAKKGTGVHWLKLLLYSLQILYHLSSGGFFLVDGHADYPYKCER